MHHTDDVPFRTTEHTQHTGGEHPGRTQSGHQPEGRDRLHKGGAGDDAQSSRQQNLRIPGLIRRFMKSRGEGDISLEVFKF